MVLFSFRRGGCRSPSRIISQSSADGSTRVLFARGRRFESSLCNQKYQVGGEPIAHNLFGRRKLTTHYSVITDENVSEVLSSVLSDMAVNESQIGLLYDYYRGNQRILSREKKIRPEICNKAVENHALEIVSFKTGYIFGEPIQYVCRASDEAKRESRGVANLNERMYLADKAYHDKKMADWMFIAGCGYRFLRPDSTSDAGYHIETLDPRYTGVVYTTDVGGEPVMSIQKKRDENDQILYWVYTPYKLYKFRDTMLEASFPNTAGFIPIFEYTANEARLGAFEPVIDLLDALNTAVNNRLDGVEQFIQSFFKGINVKMDETLWDSLRDKGFLLFNSDPGNPADVELISAELNQTQAQVLTDYIYQQILTVCDMPDRNGSNRTTGDTGQAVILRDGWSAAEAYARSVTMNYEPSEKRFIAAVLRVLDTQGAGLGITVADVGVKIAPNMTDNMLTKTQALQNMLEAGIHPRIAIAHCKMFSDPEQVYLDSLPYLKRWETADAAEVSTPANNKPNPDEKST